MRHIRFASLMGILATAGTVAVVARGQEQKAASGIFVEAAGSQPEVRLPSTRFDVKESGVGKSMMTMGLTKPQTVGSLVGAKAETRVSGDATFRMQFGQPSTSAAPNMSPADMMSMMNGGGDGSMPPMAKSPQDVLLVKLNVVDDNREGHFGMGSSRPKDAVDLVVESAGSGVYRVKPKHPLAPGEYAFYVRMGGGMPAGPAWAFGVDGK